MPCTIPCHPGRVAATRCAAVILAGVLCVSSCLPVGFAATVTTFQLTSDGGSDPVWGQGITINVNSSPPDALIPPNVALEFVGLRMGDPNVGSPGRTAAYLHIYDAFGIDAGGAVDGSAIGNLVAVSTNTVNLETAGPSTDVFWLFDGPVLAKDTNLSLHHRQQYYDGNVRRFQQLALHRPGGRPQQSTLREDSTIARRATSAMVPRRATSSFESSPK